MRLFIAIPVPQELHRYCRQLQDRFKGIRRTDDFHITLQFLGDNTEDAEPIVDALKKIKFEPFEIEFGDTLPFGPKHEPRGVWIECRENKALDLLASNIQEKLAPLGFEADKPFRAHITLGRYKTRPADLPEREKGLSHRFSVKGFELIQSHLGQKGPHYQTLASFET